MDGKKRIARLRNEQKWQRLQRIFGGAPPKPQPAKVLKVKNPNKGWNPVLDFAPAANRTWDYHNMCYVERGNSRFDSGHNFIEALKKRGYEQLGSGAYSTVLGKPGSSKVLKVTRGNQDDWIDYIQWAAKNGYCGNFAPRVYSWKKFSKKNTFSVSVVERMKEEVRMSKNDYALIEHLIYPARKGIGMAEVYMEDLLPGALKFFKELVKEFDANDIYGKNMMIRPDGSFCVTDPVCGRIRTDKTRLRSKDFTSLAPAIRRFYCELLLTLKRIGCTTPIRFG